MDRPLVILDGDDTLWWAEELYDAARTNAAKIVADAGLNAYEWELIERDIDVKNVKALGLSARRFPTSCVDAYRALAAREGLETDDLVARSIYEAASAVFRQRATLVPGASDALADLSAFADLALLTKGDPAIQRKRIDDSGLEPYFRAVRIVEDKTPTCFEDLCRAMAARPLLSWSVGNSLRSDILPAVQAGMKAVWIDAHVWEHERHIQLVSHPNIVKAATIDEVPDVIRTGNAGMTERTTA